MLGWQRANIPGFRRIPTYVITIHQRYRQTDRQTCDRNTALCTKVHRAVKTASERLKQSYSGVHGEKQSIRRIHTKIVTWSCSLEQRCAPDNHIHKPINGAYIAIFVYWLRIFSQSIVDKRAAFISLSSWYWIYSVSSKPGKNFWITPLWKKVM